MTFDSGDDPSITITRQSKTPESPRPIQPPQPSNIPVLQNQNNLLFNLVTSHTSPPFAARNMTAMDHELASLATEQQSNAPVNGDFTGTNEAEQKNSLTRNAQETTETVDTQAEQVSDNQNQSTTNNEQAPATVAPSESELPTSQSIPSANPAEQTVSSNPFTEAEDEIEIEQQQPEAVPVVSSGNEVNYQALLDHIIASSAATSNAGGTITADTSQRNLAIGDANNASSTVTGLPPRPPPQDQPSIHPNYTADQDIRSFHYPSAQAPNTASNPISAGTSFQQQPAFPTPGISLMSGPNPSGLPPPPLPSFQQPLQTFQQPSVSMHERSDSQASRYDDDKKWPPQVQQMYEDFLKQEEFYTKDGAWDKFPPGSRLFVGNLPTEVVTKRDIFHCFFRFGKIAQISIKQAYGFVQFMDKDACTAALHGEQGAKIKDRSMHLEVSKPPKSRGGGGGGGGGSGAVGGANRNDRNRRSRSPESRRPGSAGLGRNGRKLPSSDYRDEPRRRDDYRPGRSPSPRGYNRGDEFRDRSPGRYRNRSRSPRGRGSKYGRSPSPRRRSIDEDDGLPMPRRHPRDVPDVQLILLDELDKPFIDYLEKAFRDRSLRTAVLYLPQIPVQALIKRQILEGVQAVVRVDRSTRNSGRIPIQVFDRTAGAANIRFDEYDNIDANTAAELVVRAKAKEAASASQYSAPNPYQTAQYAAPALQQAIAQQPNIANLISSLDGPALQGLLSAMQQPGANAVPQPQIQSQPDIQALLGSLGRQSATSNMSSQAASTNYGSYQQPSQPQQAAYGGYPQGQQQQQPPYGQQYPTANPATNVQGVLDRLGRWKQ